MNKAAIIGGGFLVLAAGAAAYPYFVGMKAEAALRADHELMARELVLPGLTIELESYQRGYLKSNAVTAISYTPEAGKGQPLRFEFHHQISHLPSLSHAAIASATSELVLPAEMQQAAAQFLAGQSPLTVTTYIGLSGSESATLSSPAFNTVVEEKTNIAWQGVQGTATESGDNSHMTTNLTMPGLTVDGPEGSLSFNDMRYTADMTRGSHEMWFGTAEGSLKALQFGNGDAAAIAINDLRFNSEQQERGEVSDATVVIELGASSFAGVSVDSAVYDLELRNLDTKTMADIQAAMREAYASSDESQIGLAVLGAVPGLLKAQPELNIRRLQFNSSLGNFDGKLHLAYTGEWNEEMMGNPLAMVAMINADLDFSISKSLMVMLGQSQMRNSIAAMAEMHGEELSDEEIDAMARERAAQQLELLAANEYLLEKDDLYTSKIHFEKGQLTINGKSANEFFGGQPR